MTKTPIKERPSSMKKDIVFNVKEVSLMICLVNQIVNIVQIQEKINQILNKQLVN